MAKGIETRTFAQVVEKALSEPKFRWTIDAQDDGEVVTIRFHRHRADWELTFRLLKDRHYLVETAEMTENGKVLFSSEVHYRVFEDGRYLPDEWRESWYEAYLGPISSAAPESQSNRVCRDRFSKLLSYSRNTGMECAELDWHKLDLPESIQIVRTTTEGKHLLMRKSGEMLLPADLLLELAPSNPNKKENSHEAE